MKKLLAVPVLSLVAALSVLAGVSLPPGQVQAQPIGSRGQFTVAILFPSGPGVYTVKTNPFEPTFNGRGQSTNRLCTPWCQLFAAPAVMSVSYYKNGHLLGVVDASSGTTYWPPPSNN